MLYAIHDALVRPYPGHKMGPSLAESWKESPDGKTYEFKLRPGLKFHNGDPVTTEDVKFSFERYKGAGAKVLQERVAQVEIVDPLMVRFHLKEPWPDFMTFYGTTATAAGIVVPKKYLDAGRRRRLQEASDRRRPLQVRQPQAGRRGRAGGQSRLLAPRAERQDAGHEERARSDHARRDAEDRRGRHRLRARRPRGRGRSRRDPRLQLVAVQARVDLLDRVRRAVGPEVALARQAAAPGGRTYALDRKRINEAACLGFCPPAGVIVPRVMDFALQVEPPAYDPRKAKQLLAEAGYPNGLDAGEFAPIPGFPTVAEAVVNDLNAVGIRVRMRADGARGVLRRLAGEEAARAVHDRGRQLRQRRQPRGGVHLLQGRLRLRRLSRHRRALPAAGARARRREARGAAAQDPAAHDRPGDVRAGHGPARADAASGRASPSTRSPTSG